jgi:putative protease
LEEAKKLKLNIHLSTQASVSNSKSANFYKKLGVSRIILARECTLRQIKEISKNSKIEIETFVHGAMCVSISGRCFLSQEIFGKSANRGECIQPCRREYTITDAEEKHKLKLGKDYVMSPKDLCALPFIEKLVKSGVKAFKIEGRNRSPEYVKAVTSSYRNAIDDYYNKKLTKEKIKSYISKLKKVYNRGFSSGFYLGLPTARDFTKSYGSRAATRKKYIGFVRNFYKKVSVAEIKLEAGDLKSGDSILVIGNKTGVKEEKISSMQVNKKEVKKVKKGSRVGIKTKNLMRENDKVYVIKSAN